MSVAATIARGVDATISDLIPGRALKKAVESHGLKRIHRLSGGSYSGAARNRYNRDWRTSGGSADADLDEGTLATLRERSRDRARNDGVANAILVNATDNVVGPNGLVPNLKLDPEVLGISIERANLLSKQAEQLWRSWSRVADASYNNTMPDLQGLAFLSSLTNGDVFALPVTVNDGRSPITTRIELIEADRCATPDGTAGVPKEIRASIRNGVEVGRRGQAKAFYISEAHPGDDMIPGMRLRHGSRKFRRIRAWNRELQRPNILHLFQQLRPGQSRGQPLLAPVLSAFRYVDKYVEAELVAAEVAACFSVFVTQAFSQDGADLVSDPDPTDPEEREQSVSPGAIYHMEPGESVSAANPGRPNPQFGAFVERCMRFICNGLGIPYEVAMGDFGQMNYSSARTVILQARRNFQRRQRWLRDRFLQPVWEMVLEEAWAAGLFDAGPDFLERKAEWCKTKWVPPGWGWVDPDKELKAAKLELELGVTTREDICAVNGRDFEEVTHQLAIENELRRELLGAGPQVGDDDGGDDEQEEDEESPQEGDGGDVDESGDSDGGSDGEGGDGDD